jgi:hypothetical protein
MEQSGECGMAHRSSKRIFIYYNDEATWVRGITRLDAQLRNRKFTHPSFFDHSATRSGHPAMCDADGSSGVDRDSEYAHIRRPNRWIAGATAASTVSSA